MFKYQKLLQNSSLRKAIVFWHPRRTQHSGKPKQSGLNLVFAGSALVAVSTVGVVGYVSWSSSNRQKVENSIPGSKYVFNLLMGPLPQISPSLIPTPQDQDVGLLQKKIERQRSKLEEEKQSDEIGPPITEALPQLPNVNVTIDNGKSLPVNPQRGEPEEKIDTATDTLSEKDKLAVLLENLSNDARKHSSEAMSAAEEVTSIIRKYFEVAYHAIENVDGQEELYKAASEAANLKSELMKAAEEKLSIAKQSVSNLRSNIEEGRRSIDTENDPILANANDVVAELANQVAKITSIVSEAVRDCSAVGELHELVDQGKKQLEMEVKSLLPNLKIGDSGEMTADEMNILLAHAHKKILLMQGAIARNQTLDKDKQKNSQGLPDYERNYADANIKIELDRQKHELTSLHRHRIAEMREELDAELHSQLKRQAAAHTDHLTDALRLQQSDLDRKWKNVLHDGLQQLQIQYFTALSEIDGELNGLKEGMNSRAKVNEEAIKAQTLWVACEALRSRLRLSSGQTWQQKLEPLKDNVDAIRRAAGDQNEFVDVVLTSLPEDSMSTGIYTEEALKERFIKVEKICRRVAIIGDGGASLFKYFISYLQSFLIADTYDLLTINDMKDGEVDITKLSTFDILARTKYCLEKDDLLQSIRYMKLLRGEPRNVASDWVREALRTMEARQVADVLMAFSAATVGRAL